MGSTQPHRRQHGSQGTPSGNPALVPSRSARSLDARALRQRIGVTRPVMARLVDVSERSLADYETDKRQPSPPVWRRLREVDRLRVALERIMAPDDLAEWLQTPNEAFEGLKPLEVIERGETDRIWRMVYLIESGAPF